MVIILLFIVGIVLAVMITNGDFEAFISEVTGNRKFVNKNDELSKLRIKVDENTKSIKELTDRIDTFAVDVQRLDADDVSNANELLQLRQWVDSQIKTLKTQATQSTASKEQPVKEEPRVEKRKYYTSSPSSLSPVRFAQDRMSETPEGHFYVIDVVDGSHAQLTLTTDNAELKQFILALKYQLNCVDVVSQPSSAATSVDVLTPGSLKWNDGEWVLEKKIQIKII